MIDYFMRSFGCLVEVYRLESLDLWFIDVLTIMSGHF